MRQPKTFRNDHLPRIWLMTDPRLGAGLLPAIKKLPAGSGVVFRHYALAPAERRRLFAAVRRICRQRGHCLLLAGEADFALARHVDGFHGRGRRCNAALLRSAPVHNLAELRAAKTNGADLIFLSPLFATRSHPGAPVLGISQFNRFARLAQPTAIIALGGMNRVKARMLDAHLVHGWGGIDAFSKRPA